MDQMSTGSTTTPTQFLQRFAVQTHRSWVNSPGLPTSIKGGLTDLCDHENFQHRAVITKEQRGPTGRESCGSFMEHHRDCWCCTLHWPQLHFLGEKHSWIHSSLAITGTYRYTGSKTDCFHPGWLHTPSVTRSSSIQGSVSIMLCCWFFFSPTPWKKPILDWPTANRLIMILLDVEWKHAVQRADFCLEAGIYTMLSLLEGWGEEMVLYDISWVSQNSKQ